MSENAKCTKKLDLTLWILQTHGIILPTHAIILIPGNLYGFFVFTLSSFIYEAPFHYYIANSLHKCMLKLCISIKLDSCAIWLQLESAYEKCFRLSHQ